MSTYCVGLTGGIGSGKTTVSSMFAELGVPIIDADKIAKHITMPNESAYRAIVSHFGNAILCADNLINRDALRNLIFDDQNEKLWLESLLHPLIRDKMKAEIATITKPYSICVIPLLAETKGIDFLNRVLVVETTIEEQFVRTKMRDQLSGEIIEKIIHSQANNETRRAIADDVLINNRDMSALREEIVRLHEIYLELAAQA